jgi:hypothetical protein
MLRISNISVDAGEIGSVFGSPAQITAFVKSTAANVERIFTTYRLVFTNNYSMCLSLQAY